MVRRADANLADFAIVLAGFVVAMGFIVLVDAMGDFLAGFIEIRIPQEIGDIADTQEAAKVDVAEIRHDCPH